MKQRNAWFLIVLLLGSFAARHSEGSQALVGLSLGDLKEERWKKDRDIFRAEIERLGGRVLLQDAGGDAAVQIEQCKNLLLQGVQVLVVIPKNADAASPIVAHAHRKGVKVISYDRLITRETPDVYLSFNNYRVGELQAEEILKLAPKGKYLLLGGDPADQNAYMLREGQMKVLSGPVHRGDIRIVADPYCDKWLRAEAERYTQDSLTKHPDLVAIVASNDGTAGGAIAALKSRKKAGEIFVSGQDADLEACRNILKGYQSVTVYKPIRKLAQAAARLAVSFAAGEGLDAAKKNLEGVELTRVQSGKTEVPALFLTPIGVTKANLDEVVVGDGFHGRDEIYEP